MVDLDRFGTRLPVPGDVSFSIINFCSQCVDIKIKILKELHLADLLIFMAKLGDDEVTRVPIKWINKNRLEFIFLPPPTITTINEENLKKYVEKEEAVKKFFHQIRYINPCVTIPIDIHVFTIDELEYFNNIFIPTSMYDIKLYIMELDACEFSKLKRFKYLTHVSYLNILDISGDMHANTLDLSKYFKLKRLAIGPNLNVNIKFADEGKNIETFIADGEFNKEILANLRNLKCFFYTLGGQSFNTKCLPKSIKYLHIDSDFRGGSILVTSLAEIPLQSIQLESDELMLSSPFVFPHSLEYLRLKGIIPDDVWNTLPADLKRLELICTSEDKLYKLTSRLNLPHSLQYLKIKGMEIKSDMDKEIIFPSSLTNLNITNSSFITPLNAFKFNKDALKSIIISNYRQIGNNNPYYSNINFTMFKKLKIIKFSCTNLLFCELKVPTTIERIVIHNESIPEISETNSLFHKDSHFPFLAYIEFKDCGIQSISRRICLPRNLRSFTLVDDCLKSFYLNRSMYTNPHLEEMSLGCLQEIDFVQDEESNSNNRTNLKKLIICVPNSFKLKAEFYGNFGEYFGRSLGLHQRSVLNGKTEFEFRVK
ncbi:hypothetical protein DFJ63DRAFT_310386 [Scheffersomyces coipomensis]|uniref:uncharacterized protein n=1 Tax=Scheffersomyces coipomensis TaxID=1788519 RepID=UPI00315CA46D